MVTKLRNNKILCVLWLLLCASLFFFAIQQYSINSLDGYFNRHPSDETNPYALIPATTEAYNPDDFTSYEASIPESSANSVFFYGSAASDYTGYTTSLLYLLAIGFLLSIIGGFFFCCFHPKLPQEIFLFLFLFCLFQFLGDSLTVRFYQNFGRLFWAFELICFLLGILCAISFLCFLWSWKNKGLHGSILGEWFFQRISAKGLPAQLFSVIFIALIGTAAASGVELRIIEMYFWGIQSPKNLALICTSFAVILFTSILLFFLAGPYSITADMDALVQKSIRTTLEQEKLKVDLITNISHDLKTPLTSIIGYEEQLARQNLPPKAMPILNKLQHKSSYLLDMVEEVFELSKASSGYLPMKCETIDIGRLLEQTLGEMDEELCESGFRLKKEYPQKGMLVCCDGLHMHRVFQNLFDNALKYACPQTRIFIRARLRSDNFCEIRVRNTSRVPLDFDPEEITERFVRGEKARTGEGSGLGLAIAKTYTESCGGQFHILIEDDTFTAVVCLPIQSIGHSLN